MKVVVLDVQSGNVRSAVRMLERVGADVELTRDYDAVLNADGLVVPGVGAFASVLDKLKRFRADELIERRLAGGRPVFGICVGMQVMFDQGTEHGTHEGLGQWRGSVDLLPAAVVPHMGWSPVQVAQDSQLFAGVADERFYFVHSYAAQNDPGEEMNDYPELFEAPKVTFAEHGVRFVAAVENGPLSGTQFHPEKSGDAGAELMKNWLATL